MTEGTEQDLRDLVDYQVIMIGGNKYHLYNNDSVYLNGTLVTKDGQEGLNDYYYSQKTNFTYEGVTYYVYNNGTVTTVNGTTFVSTGGKEQLYEELSINVNSTGHVSEIPVKVIEISGVKYYIYKDDRVSYFNGTTLFEEGGEELLKNKT